MLGLQTHKVDCPYCGERFDAVIDYSESEQSYIEDCWVCCRPITFHISVGEDGEPFVYLQHENEC